ncbi:MAG TPA: proline iminopeptidase-family hydrolase [Candidatus Wallbacteria bacterium]|nr:proline iminopeptidase-family hydrolase [Candidatus Wallbacteria bacterium]
MIAALLLAANFSLSYAADETDNAEGKVAVEGGNIWYKIVGKSKKGVPLLVVHGGPGATHDYLEPLEALADERPVIFYDQLGSGKSDRPSDEKLWTVERFVRELAALRKELKLEKVHILGQSWGTMLAASYMLAEKPSGVVSLIFSGPFFSSKIFAADCRERVKKLNIRSVEAIFKAESKGDFSGEEYKMAMDEFYKKHVCNLAPWPECFNRTLDGMGFEVYSSMWGPSEFSVTGTLKDLDITGRLGEITVPALLTGGEFDEISPETVKSYAAKFKNSKFLIFDGCTHSHHLEKTGEYIKEIINFIKNAENKM